MVMLHGFYFMLASMHCILCTAHQSGIHERVLNVMQLRGREYCTWRGFVADFELICSNAMTYNQKRSRVHKSALSMLRAGKKQLQAAELEGRKVGHSDAEQTSRHSMCIPFMLHVDIGMAMFLNIVFLCAGHCSVASKRSHSCCCGRGSRGSRGRAGSGCSCAPPFKSGQAGSAAGVGNGRGHTIWHTEDRVRRAPSSGICCFPRDSACWSSRHSLVHRCGRFPGAWPFHCRSTVISLLRRAFQ